MRYFFLLLILFACQSSFKENPPAISSENLDELLTQDIVVINNPFTCKITGYPLIGQTEDGIYLYATKKALLFIEMEPYESFYEGYGEHHNIQIKSPSKNSPSYLMKKVGEIPFEGQPKISLTNNRLIIEKIGELTLLPKPRNDPFSEPPINNAQFICNLSSAALTDFLPSANPTTENDIIESDHPACYNKIESSEEFAYTYLGAIKKTLHVFRKSNDQHVILHDTNGSRGRYYRDDQLVILTFENQPMMSVDWTKKTIQWDRAKILAKKIGEKYLGGSGGLTSWNWGGDIAIEADRVLIGHNWFDYATEDVIPTEPQCVIECENCPEDFR